MMTPRIVSKVGVKTPVKVLKAGDAGVLESAEVTGPRGQEEVMPLQQTHP